MQLLVSVRGSAEVAAAVAGGADIVDAKEPARGPLGAVDPDVLADIAQALPGSVPLSVALGDAGNEMEVDRLLVAFQHAGVTRARYLKVGFAGVRSAVALRAAISTATAGARALEGCPALIAVAYADHERAHSIQPKQVAELAAAAGAAGVLLDTWTKDGRDLLDWISLPVLSAWVEKAKGAGLLVAVAGSLTGTAVPVVAQADPHVIGIRGAACRGGRLGVVSRDRVREVSRALTLLAGAPWEATT